MTPRLFTADWIHRDGTFRADHALLVGPDGRVVANGPRAEVEGLPEAAGTTRHDLPGRGITPGTVSAHSHAFQVFLRGAGDHPLSFSDWVSRVLYPVASTVQPRPLLGRFLRTATSPTRSRLAPSAQLARTCRSP